MRSILVLPAVIRSAVYVAAASQHSFSVNDDLLAFPQYQIHFADEYVRAEDAEHRLFEHGKRTFDAELSELQRTPSDGATHDSEQSHVKDQSPDAPTLTYERMVLDGHDFLCSIPQVEPPTQTDNSQNETVTQADKEKELARAVDRGWELLSGMQDNCIYFISGWWSYRFCYGQGVKQFHQLPPSRGVPAYPPVEDPMVPSFELGHYGEQTKRNAKERAAITTDVSTGEQGQRHTARNEKELNIRGEVVDRGESRYLVQRLTGGTKCDLTGKDRRIEVQFHCHPQSADRISLIKETATCAYLMVIQTPRLCNDVAFLPRQRDDPLTVECLPILHADQIDQYERNLEDMRTMEEAANFDHARDELAAVFGFAVDSDEDDVLGDIVVGGHARIPKGKRLEKGVVVGGGKETLVGTVATSDGRMLSEEELKKLGVHDSRAIKELKKELEKRADGKEWKVEVVDTPLRREVRGIVGDASVSEPDDQQPKRKPDTSKQKKTKGATGKESGDDPDEGSEEEYYPKDEL